MPVLHVTQRLTHDGASTQLRLLARAEGVGCVASLRRPETHEDRVRTVWLGARSRFDPSAALRLRRLIARTGADAIQTWDLPSARLVRWSLAGAPRPIWLHTLRSALPAPGGREPWVGRLARCAEGVVVPSTEVGRRARRLGVESQRVATVPNGFDSALSRVDEARRRAARGRLNALGLGIDERSPVIGLVARLDDAERIKEAAWHADLLRIVRPGLRLMIVGDGPRKNDCERFAALATEPGLVHFVGSHSSWRKLIDGVDVVWCLSRHGSAPTPLVEALALGLPVVASREPGREALIDEATGVLVDWDDRAGWSRATNRLLEDAGLRERLGAAGSERVAEWHAGPVVAARWSAELESLRGVAGVS